MHRAWLIAGVVLFAGCSGSTNGTSGSTGGSGSSTTGTSASSTTGTGGSSGSTGGGAGWSNSLAQGTTVVEASAENGGDAAPSGSDTWYTDLHDDTFNAQAGGPHTDSSASFTIATAGNTITLTGSASAHATLDSSTNLVPTCGSDADLGSPVLCYRAPGATSIHFAFDCSGTTATGSAANGGGVGSLSVALGVGGSNPQDLCIVGNPLGADVTAGSTDVAADATGQACIRTTDALEIRWEASAGRPNDNSTDCTASATAHVVITATAH